MNTNLPVLNLGRYELRTVIKEDYLDYFEIGKDEETCRHLNWGPFINPKEALWCIEEIFLKRPMTIGLPAGYSIIDKQNDHKMIGMIDFHTYYASINTAEIGYILHRDYWNQGIMKRCLKEMTRIGFEYLLLDKILIGHTLGNQASKQVILQNGYHYEYRSLVKIKNNERIAMYYSLYRYEYKGV
ncbi:MAG: GNAT family N-acetyltransferase [Anaeroplasmataceae bacterium]|nr:GNAT family N-acetyltransferase [Anaeroplasmataceae bacterium]MDE7101073.1 GNAT family N-acetyltransferase [Anaeroplasmataceae bacterium]